MGIDPGLVNTGYGVLDYCDGKTKVVEGGVVQTRSKDSMSKRLKLIYDEICEVVGRLNPAEVAIEDLHSVANYAKTAILMGHARGVIVLAAGKTGAPVYEYQPTSIKSMVAGFGRATKKQVMDAVAIHLGVPLAATNEHVADAFAVALCHAHKRSTIGLNTQ